MAWAKIDDQFFFNPKVVRAGRDARDLYLAGLTYAAGQLTDGFLPTGALALLAAMAGITGAEEAAGRLGAEGLWEPVDGGWQVHDWPDYNPRAKDVKAARVARAEAGKRGAIAKQKSSKSSGKSLANGEHLPSISSGKTEANGLANGWQKSAPSPSPSPILQQQQPAREERAAVDTDEARMFTALTESGRAPSSMESQQWLDMLADTGWPLLSACLDEAARQGKPPSPAYVSAMAQRCKREGVQPGQWRDKQARASPAPPKPETPRKPLGPGRNEMYERLGET
jgi:hypothetical protein